MSYAPGIVPTDPKALTEFLTREFRRIGALLTDSRIASLSAPVITNGATLVTANVSVARVAPGGAVTGVILQVGTVNAQDVTVVNESASSVTFAAAGTSHVANGTGAVIAALTGRRFVWNAYTSLWYPAP